MNSITITTKDGSEGFHFGDHWIRIVRNVQTAINTEEQVGFIAADLAKALEIQRTNDVTGRLDPDQKGTVKTRTPSGEQEMSFVTESGLYDVVIRSNKPKGKALRAIVTREILPQIRRTGKYDPALTHQLHPEYNRIRKESKRERIAYTDKLKQLKAERKIGHYTNDRYVVLTGGGAKQIQRERGPKAGKCPIAKDLLTVEELIINQTMEMSERNQLELQEVQPGDLNHVHAVHVDVTSTIHSLLHERRNSFAPPGESKRGAA